MQKRTGLIIALAVIAIAALMAWLITKPSIIEEPIGERVTEEAKETVEESSAEEIPEEFQDNLDKAFEDLDTIDS